MPNDRDFALIERKIKLQSEIFLPSNSIDIIKSTRNEEFKVNSMSRQDFFSTKKLESSITNRRVTINKTWIRLEKQHPFQRKFKNSFLDEDFSVIDISKRGNELINLFQVIPNLSYPNERCISSAKKKDILDLLQYIPVEFHSF